MNTSIESGFVKMSFVMFVIDFFAAQIITILILIS